MAVVPSPCCGNHDQLPRATTTTTRSRSAAVMVRWKKWATRLWCPPPTATTTTSSRGGDGDEETLVDRSADEMEEVDHTAVVPFPCCDNDNFSGSQAGYDHD